MEGEKALFSNLHVLLKKIPCAVVKKRYYKTSNLVNG